MSGRAETYQWAVPVALAIALGALCGCQAAAEPQDPNRVVAWNDDCQPIWDAKWGGEQVRALLDPNIEELRRLAGCDVESVYLHDMERWLRAALRPELVPPDLAHHAVAVGSRIYCATDTALLPRLKESVERIGLTAATTPTPGINSSGILVRYETRNRVVLVVDTARSLLILVRDKQPKNDEAYGTTERVRRFWSMLPVVFNNQVSQLSGGPPTMSEIGQAGNHDVMDVWLYAYNKRVESPKEFRHFEAARLTLPPGPVIRVVFFKRLVEKEIKARVYMPRSRFENGTLFDNQQFDPPPPPPPEKPVTRKLSEMPDSYIPPKRGRGPPPPSPPATP